MQGAHGQAPVAEQGGTALGIHLAQLSIRQDEGVEALFRLNVFAQSVAGAGPDVALTVFNDALDAVVGQPVLVGIAAPDAACAVDEGQSVAGGAGPDAVLGVFDDGMHLVGIAVAARHVDVLIGRLVLHEGLGREHIDAFVGAEPDATVVAYGHRAWLGNGMFALEEQAYAPRTVGAGAYQLQGAVEDGYPHAPLAVAHDVAHLALDGRLQRLAVDEDAPVAGAHPQVALTVCRGRHHVVAVGIVFLYDVQLGIGGPQVVLAVAYEDAVAQRTYQADGVDVALVLGIAEVAGVLVLANLSDMAYADVLLADPKMSAVVLVDVLQEV